MELNNKVAIITGSAQGLGKAFAVRLLEVGVRVCISDVNAENGEMTLKELRERFGQDKVHFVACDVTSDEQFKNLFDKAEEFFKVNCIDILANNAGVNVNFGWKKCMDINIMAVINGTEIAVERMKKAGKAGQIINTASMAAFAPGFHPSMMPYTVSKHGVVAMTRTLATEENSAISHKAICPAWTDTAIVSSADLGDNTKQMLDAHIKKSGGMMTPEHVAEGFYRLLTQCGNGSCMVIIKDFPYIVVPEYSKNIVLSFAIMSKLIGKVMNPEVVTGKHLLLGFFLLFFVFFYILTILF